MEKENKLLTKEELFSLERLPVRENLVTTAVNFLQAVKADNLSMKDKEYYFIKKGLNEREISIAYQRFGELAAPTTVALASVFYRHLSQLNFFDVLTKTLKFVAVFSAAGYVIYLFYKKFIVPYYTYPKPKTIDDHLDDLTEMVETSFADVRTNIARVQEKVHKLKEVIDSDVYAKLKKISEKSAGLYRKPTNSNNPLPKYKIVRNLNQKPNETYKNNTETKPNNKNKLGVKISSDQKEFPQIKSVPKSRNTSALYQNKQSVGRNNTHTKTGFDGFEYYAMPIVKKPIKKPESISKPTSQTQVNKQQNKLYVGQNGTHTESKSVRFHLVKSVIEKLKEEVHLMTESETANLTNKNVVVKQQKKRSKSVDLDHAKSIVEKPEEEHLLKAESTASPTSENEVDEQQNKPSVDENTAVTISKLANLEQTNNVVEKQEEKSMVEVQEKRVLPKPVDLNNLNPREGLESKIETESNAQTVSDHQSLATVDVNDEGKKSEIVKTETELQSQLNSSSECKAEDNAVAIADQQDGEDTTTKV